MPPWEPALLGLGLCDGAANGGNFQSHRQVQNLLRSLPVAVSTVTVPWAAAGLGPETDLWLPDGASEARWAQRPIQGQTVICVCRALLSENRVSVERRRSPDPGFAAL